MIMKKKSLKGSIFYFLLSMILIAILGGVLMLPKLLSVKQVFFDGKEVTSKTDVVFRVGEIYCFDVAQKVSFLSSDFNYIVKVVPTKNIEHDFIFLVENQEHHFLKESDLTEGFNIVKDKNKILVTPKGNIFTILSNVYFGKLILPAVDLNLGDYFLLQIFDGSEKNMLSEVGFTVENGGFVLVGSVSIDGVLKV